MFCRNRLRPHRYYQYQMQNHCHHGQHCNTGAQQVLVPLALEGWEQETEAGKTLEASTENNGERQTLQWNRDFRPRQVSLNG